MRLYVLTLVALAGVALAQTTNQQPVAPAASGMVIQGGYASTQVTSPAVVTPHVTLGVASSNPVGATSSASGLQVGATSAAIPPTTGQQTIVNEAIVSSGNANPGNTRTGTGPAAAIVAPATANAQTGASTNEQGGVIGAVEPGPDVAEAARYYRTHRQHAVRTYTNDDINRMRQEEGSNSGMKTEMPASDVNAPSTPSSANPAATMPQADQQQIPSSQVPANTPPPESKSKPAPYTPPATPPQD